MRIEREEDHYAYISVGYQGGYRVTSSWSTSTLPDPRPVDPAVPAGRAETARH